MKIVILHSHLTKLNGAGHMITEIANGLDVLGHEVTIMAAAINDEIYEFNKGVNLQEFNKYTPRNPLFWLTIPLIVRTFTENLSIIKPDYILANHFPSNWVLLNSDVKGHWLCHEPYPYFYDFDEIEQDLSVQMGARLSSLIYSKMDIKAARSLEILANSRHTQESIRRIFKRQSEVLHPGFSNELLEMNRSIRKDGSILSIGPSKPLKRFEITVKSMMILSKKLPNLKLKVVGPIWESYRRLLGDLEKKSKINIEVLGILPRSEYYKEIQKAEVVSFPSYEEPFGIVPLEAAALGTPVVYFKSGGLLDSMINGVTGIGVDEGDIFGFVTALEHTLKGGLRIDPTSPELEIHFKKFTWESVVKKLLSKIEARRKKDGYT